MLRRRMEQDREHSSPFASRPALAHRTTIRSLSGHCAGDANPEPAPLAVPKRSAAEPSGDVEFEDLLFLQAPHETGECRCRCCADLLGRRAFGPSILRSPELWSVIESGKVQFQLPEPNSE